MNPEVTVVASAVTLLLTVLPDPLQPRDSGTPWTLTQSSAGVTILHSVNRVVCRLTRDQCNDDQSLNPPLLSHLHETVTGWEAQGRALCVRYLRHVRTPPSPVPILNCFWGLSTLLCHHQNRHFLGGAKQKRKAKRHWKEIWAVKEL